MPHFRLSFTMSMASAASRVAKESTEHLKIAHLRCGRQPLSPNNQTFAGQDAALQCETTEPRTSDSSA